MSERWVRRTVTAKLLSDAHLGSGAGGGGIDALLSRDRHDRPVIWSSHIEGVLRDAARRLHGDREAEKFFGRAGGDRQRVVFTSLYLEERPETRIWRSTARDSFENRAPKDDTLRVVEYVPKGTTFVGEVELPENSLSVLERLLREVDALGSGRSSGAGRVELTLAERSLSPRTMGQATGRLVLLLKNRDPLCITATATPDNLVPSLSFVPGRTLIGAVAAWLIAEGERDIATLLTSGCVSVSDALPLPALPPAQAPMNLENVEVLPAPHSLQSEKPKGWAGDLPWWTQRKASPRRLHEWSEEAQEAKKEGAKLKRPEDDLFVYRDSGEQWSTFRPSRRVRLRNGRPDPKQLKSDLFAIEQIVEETTFLADISGPPEDMKNLAQALAPILEGRRWLRVGRAGAPVEVAQLEWATHAVPAETGEKALLTLTSDLLIRDEYLRWRTALDDKTLREALNVENITIVKTERGADRALPDSVMVHGFSGTSRLWRMPAAAIRRGSVFEISGEGIAQLAQRAANGKWLGERTHEGFGRFRVDSNLPGVTGDPDTNDRFPKGANDASDEAIAARTQEWFKSRGSLARSGGSSDRTPSLSQWLDLVSALENGDAHALKSRLEKPTTAGGKSWEHNDAKAILEMLNDMVNSSERAAHARFFVRWLRAEMRSHARKETA
jgi:hypothetical protein